MLCNRILPRLFRPRRFAFFAAFLLLLPVLGVFTLAPSAVEAQTNRIILDPTSGPPGTRVRISGDFNVSSVTGVRTENRSLRLKFGSGSQQSFGSFGSNGSFQRSATIPDSPSGSLAITVEASWVQATTTTTTNDAGETSSNTVRQNRNTTAAATFTVEPEASISVNSGPVGRQVTVTGKGFEDRERVTVTFGSEDVRNAVANAKGNLNASFAVPALPAGEYSVLAGDVVAGEFTVTSEFAVSPGQGPPGTSVRITGSGYSPNSTVTLNIGGEPLAPLRADQRGQLSGTVRIPSTSGGSKVITASAVGAEAAQAPFNVTPTLVISPTTATPGDRVKVSGTAFRANETGIRVRFDNADVASGIQADGNGLWSADITVPNTTAGSHNITALGTSTRAGIPTRRITVGSSIRLEQPGGPPGSPIVVQGSGARANERITIDVGKGLAVAETTANDKGVWQAQVPAPPAPRGTLVIEATRASGGSDLVFFNIAPRMEVSQGQGRPGSTVTVRGEGFAANKADIPILFDTEILATVSADADGSWQATLTVPAAPRGGHQVRVSGSGPNLQALFNVQPTLEADLKDASPGAPVTVTGRGFSANETGITVQLGSTVVDQGIGADAFGSWTSNFRVPSLPAETYNLTASGAQTGSGLVPVLSIKTGATLMVTPASGVPGSTIEVAGQGFGANDGEIVVTYDGVTVASGVNSDSAGEFTASFVVPLSAGGSHAIEVLGSNQAEGVVTGFEITPTVALALDSGIAADQVNLVGGGFQANDSNIRVTFGSVLLDDGVSADANGSFEASFQVPAAPAGQYAVNAQGSNPNAPQPTPSTFQVNPNVTLSQDTGNIGTNLQVRGTGFSAGSDIALAYGVAADETVLSDQTGSFIWQLDVPVSAGGQHVISAQDNQGNRFQLPFEVESVAPAPPVLRSPDNGNRSGFFGGFQPTTRWMPVEDPSGVTYNLQVAIDPDFFDLVLEQQGLTDPAYRFTEDQALELGQYYWRVQAVDLASNAGPYSETFEIKSGIIPVWLFSAIVLFALLASGGGAYAYRVKVYRPRRVTREAPAFPEFVRISRPEIAGPAQAPSNAPSSLPALSAPQQPPSQAQPGPPGAEAQQPPPNGQNRGQRANPFRGRRTPSPRISPEQQARLQLVVDFVRAIPLLDVAPDLRWLEELIEPYAGPALDSNVFQQVLRGDLEPVYQPAWLQHPTYQQLQGEPSAMPFLEGLEAYIEAVNDCNAYTLLILRRIYQDLLSSSPSDAVTDYQWPFVLSVSQSVVAWFRGAHLVQPSGRDYVVYPLPDGSPLASLYGDANSPFPGLIIDAMNEEDLLFHRDLHIQLRNSYRQSEDARALAAKMVSINALADQLRQNIAQLGR